MASASSYPPPLKEAASRLRSIIFPRYVVEVFNDFIIVEGGDADESVSGPGRGSLFKVPFSVNESDGTITFGDAEPVQIEYKPMSGMTDLHRVLLSNPMPGVDVVYTDQETEQESLLFLTLNNKLVAITELLG